MEKYYIEWPGLARDGFTAGLSTVVPEREIDKVVICGMGGSGIVGDYVKAVADTVLDKPVYVVKDFYLPKWATSQNTLVIPISFSGNTIETIACYKKAVENKCTVVSISTGGKLGEIAFRNRTPHVTLPLVEKIPPRTALPLLLFSTIAVMMKYGLNLISLEELEGIITMLENPPIDDAKKLASKIGEELVVVATTSDLYPLAVRWKNELNENAKIPVKVEVLPEWGHNDIVGWEKPPEIPYHFIVIKPKDPPWSTMSEIAYEYFKNISDNVEVVEAWGPTYMARLVYGSQLAGLVSVYLAEKRGIDPLETKSISFYKEKLGKLEDMLYNAAINK